MPHFIKVQCRCGKTLRARIDQAGTTIRCWECRAETVVPRPSTSRRLIRECLDGARPFLMAESILSFLGGGLIVGCALAVPRVGPALGLFLLTLAAGLDLEVVRRSGLRGAPRPPAPRWISWAARCIGGPILALALTAPVLLRHVVMDHYGRLLSWQGPGVAATAVVCWLAVPLTLMLTSVYDGAGRVRARRALAAIRRHPLATAVALILVPVGLLALEAALIVFLIGQGWFRFLVVDLFPAHGADRVVLEPLVVRTVEYPDSAPLSSFLRVYVDGLGRGYALVGALPASLPRGLFMRAAPWFALTSDWRYLAVRILNSALILAAAGVLLAIQARWLGLIATVDPCRSVKAGGREGP